LDERGQRETRFSLVEIDDNASNSINRVVQIDGCENYESFIIYQQSMRKASENMKIRDLLTEPLAQDVVLGSY
jgi:hypothetical protein